MDYSQSVNKFVKNEIIRYIYDQINLSNYKYKLLEYESDLEILSKNSYNITANYYGTNCFLVFKKIDDKYHIFLIDKKTLNYDRTKLNIDSIVFIPIKINVPVSMYNGTVLDGVLLNTSNKIFIINDVYIFRGDKLLNDKLKYKMINIDKFITVQKINSQNIELIVNTVYDISQIKNLINIYIPQAKHSNYIKGVAFCSEISGSKLIYLFNNCAKEILSEKSDSLDDKLEHSYSIVENDVIVIRMKKTSTIDVYELSLSEIFNKDNKKYVKYRKIEIAHIPTCEISHMCRELFKDKEYIIMDCKYIKNKWVPIKQSEQKKPDDYTRLVKKGDNN